MSFVGDFSFYCYLRGLSVLLCLSHTGINLMPLGEHAIWSFGWPSYCSCITPRWMLPRSVGCNMQLSLSTAVRPHGIGGPEALTRGRVTGS